MLTGRESMIRVIGKRRTFLDNLHDLVSSPSHSSLKLRKDESETALNDTSTVQSTVKNAAGNDCVDCPVCSDKIPGDSYSVNSHIDLCLMRGTKRKLSQRTLFEFSFCTRLKSKVRTAEGFQEGTNVFQIDSSNRHTQNEFPQLACSGANEVTHDKNQCQMGRSCGQDSCKSSLVIGSSSQENAESFMEKKAIEDNINSMAGTYPLPQRSTSPCFDVAAVVSELSGMALETYIVGRKYGDGAEIITVGSVSLLRDPVNIKDPNAIKVISAVSDSGIVLGYLPRELAQHLSPLIDKYQLIFEGVITSVPKTSLDVVPIEIRCVQTLSFSEVGNVDLPALKTLCESALCAVNYGKKHPPTIAKYQQNFCLIVEEALRSNLHLFTDDEKSFLESFSSMSDDSQRLFVRVYRRKGPWFRVSNFSYPEILDYQQAVNELSEASYICSFSGDTEVADNDLKDLLNILTVSELCEIVHILKKDAKIAMRKKDLIALLHFSYKDGLRLLLPSLILDRTGTCIRISSVAESLLWRLQRLFFLNGEQDLLAFLLVDMGIVKYPEYKCIVLDPVFSARSNLLAYEEAVGVAQIMDQALDEHNSELLLKCIEMAESRLSSYFSMKSTSFLLEPVATFLHCFSASWVYSKVVLVGVSYFEQERRYREAIKLLKLLLSNFTSDGRRGYWTLRLSIDLEHVGFFEESLSVAEDGVLDPWVRAGSRIALQRRVIRLGKPPRRWKAPTYAASVKRKTTEVHIPGRPLNCKAGTKSRFYGNDGEQCGVEELALKYY